MKPNDIDTLFAEIVGRMMAYDGITPAIIDASNVDLIKTYAEALERQAYSFKSSYGITATRKKMTERVINTILERDR